MQLRGIIVLSVVFVFSLLFSRPAAAQTTGTAENPAPPADQPAAQAPVPTETTTPAAEPTAGKKKAEEEIVVTGTRIRRKDLTTPAPVTVISKEQVTASGRVSLGEFLQTLPEQGNAFNTQVNNGGSGATRINLRGLGNLRTLVLLNGRRMVGAGTGANSGSGVDLNSIPVAAVERIEILKDGASPLYGSDAIGGVVNIITRKGFSGTEASAYSGTSTHGDGATYDLNITTGTAGDRGSVLFSAGYYNQNPVIAGDRDWSLYQLSYNFAKNTETRVGSTRAPNGRIIGNSAKDPNGVTGNAAWLALLSANPKAGSFTYDPSLGSWRPFNANVVAPTGDLYNFQPINYDVTPARRISLYSMGDTKLGDVARGFFEASYTNRESSYQLAPEPLIIGTGGAAVTISKDNFYNPFGRDFTQYTKRLTEFGPRQQYQTVGTYRIVGGLDGTLPAGWVWDASLNYGRTQWVNTNRGNLIVSHLQNAIGATYRDSTGTLQCGAKANADGSAPFAGCVPIDLFHGEGAISSNMAQYLQFSGVSQIDNELTVAQANLAGELPIQLLADRPLALAVGYEIRWESGRDVPDPVTAAGDSTGNARLETAGRFHVNEGYGELSIPIANNMTGVDVLEASAAARVFNYSTFGSDWTYKFGGRWRIIPDVTLRGTYSTAFRAPSITDLYLGASDSFPSVKDPCADLSAATADLKANCAKDGVPAAGNGLVGETQLRTRLGGNPNLKPETAKIFTVGTVLEPSMARGLSVTVDYYYIKIDGAIAPAGASYILSRCYPDVGGRDESYCALVHRDTAGGVSRVDNFNLNVGGRETAGIDLAVRYAIPSAFGRFGLGFDGNWLQYFRQIQPDGTVINGRGNFDIGILNQGTGGVYPAFKSLSAVNWSMGGLGAGVLWRYVGGFKECADANGIENGLCATNPLGLSRRVKAYSSFDAYVSYDLKSSAGRTNFAVGAHNVFDARPPLIYAAFAPTSDPTGYDFMGRFIYARVGHRF